MKRYAWLFVLLGIAGILAYAGVDNPSPNAETLDGFTADQFIRSDASDTATGTAYTFSGSISAGSLAVSGGTELGTVLATQILTNGTGTAFSGIMSGSAGQEINMAGSRGAIFIGAYYSHISSVYDLDADGILWLGSDLSSAAGSASAVDIDADASLHLVSLTSSGSLNYTNTGHGSIVILPEMSGKTVIVSGKGSVTATDESVTNSHTSAFVIGDVGKSMGDGTLNCQGLFESGTPVLNETEVDSLLGALDVSIVPATSNDINVGSATKYISNAYVNTGLLERVGIGTKTPAEALEVNGNIKCTKAIYGGWYNVQYNNITNAVVDFNNGRFQLLTLTNATTHIWATNIVPMNVVLRVAQDATGSRTRTYDVKFDAGTNALLSASSVASTEDVESIIGISATQCYYRRSTGGFTP